MIPGLGERCEIEIEIIRKARREYHSEAYSKTNLPAAPAIMVGEEIVVQGKDISEAELEKIIRSRL
jgi:hypothetical protein